MLGKNSVKLAKETFFLSTTWKSWKVKVTTWIEKNVFLPRGKVEIQGYNMEFPIKIYSSLVLNYKDYCKMAH